MLIVVSYDLCISVWSVVISPFSFLILLIWFFSLFSWWIWLMVCYFIYLLKDPAFSFVFCYCLLHFFFTYFCSDFYYFFSSTNFGVIFSFLSSCFKYKVRLFEVSLVSWGSLVLVWISLLTAFTESYSFWIVLFSFSFVSMNILVSFLISSMICWLFRSVLLSLHMFVFLTVFFFFFFFLYCYYC